DSALGERGRQIDQLTKGGRSMSITNLKKGRGSMLISKRLTIALFIALFAGVVAQAQNPAAPARNGQSAQQLVQDIQIIIQSQQVRIAARQNIVEMQLQVFDQAGEQVFDSGLTAANEINWPLQMANDAPLKNGLYAFTLSVKEAGAPEPRVRRGHFI